MDFKNFKKQLDNTTANVVNVSNFSDRLIKAIQKKEKSFGVLLVARDDENVGALMVGELTGNLYVEYINSKKGELFRL